MTFTVKHAYEGHPKSSDNDFIKLKTQLILCHIWYKSCSICAGLKYTKTEMLQLYYFRCLATKEYWLKMVGHSFVSTPHTLIGTALRIIDNKIPFESYMYQNSHELKALCFEYLGTLHLYCVLHRNGHVYITINHD